MRKLASIAVIAATEPIPDRLSLDMLKNCLPIDWEEQRRMFIEPLK